MREDQTWQNSTHIDPPPAFSIHTYIIKLEETSLFDLIPSLIP